MAELPEEILLEIFSRLPAKSVGKLRCLSKSWHTNLSSTSFIKNHLINRQRQQQNLALITTANSLHIVTSPLKNDEKVTKCPESLGQTVGTCNGLILVLVLLTGVENDDKSELWLELWLLNPITLQQVKLPDSTHSSCNDCEKVYGFGYDCSTDDFKAIILCPQKHKLIVGVFSVKGGVCNSLDNVYPYDEDLIPSKFRYGAFVNGAVHWSICKRDSGYLCHIAAFDLAKEVFHEVPIPAEFNRNSRRIVSYADPWDYDNGLVVIGECLSMVDNLSDGATDIWMMKEYGVAESWVRFHIVAHEYGKAITPMCFVGDEQLMCYTDRHALIACDLKDGTSKKVIVGGYDTRYMDGKAFVDSLMSPGNCELEMVLGN